MTETGETGRGPGVSVELTRAIGYAVGALQVLRRRPSLLVVALLMAGLGALDDEAMTYAYRHTTWGRQMIQFARKTDVARARRLRPPTQRLPDPVEWASWIALVSPPIPSVSFAGTMLAASALAYDRGVLGSGGSAAGRRVPVWLLVLQTALAFPILSAAVTVFVVAGYMGVAREAALTGAATWRRYAHYGRRVFWRFAALGVVEFVFGVPFIILGVLTVPGFMRVLGLGWFMAAVFFLTLSPFSVVEDDSSVVAALKRSVGIVRRNLVVAALLIVGGGAPSWLALRWYLVSRSHARGHAATWDPAAPLSLLPITVSSHCIMYALGAWFCVAAFLWYRDARKQEQIERAG